VRHFGLRMRTPRTADCSPAEAAKVLSKSVLFPMIRISFGEMTSTR